LGAAILSINFYRLGLTDKERAKQIPNCDNFKKQESHYRGIFIKIL
jgi:hypothetical protein